jgi:hypothetical protein
MAESYYERIDNYCLKEIELLQNEIKRLSENDTLAKLNEIPIKIDHASITTLERLRNALTWLFD